MTIAPAVRVVLNEICVVPVPPAATGTDTGLKLTMRLATGIEVRVTVPANPFTLVMVPVETTVAGAPLTTLTEEGDRLHVKSVALTATVMGASRVLFWPVVKLLAT
jgi:hypothetical protein